MLKFAYGAIKAGIECRDNGRRKGRWEEIKNYELKERAEEVTACSEKEQTIRNWEFKNRQRDEDSEKPACPKKEQAGSVSWFAGIAKGDRTIRRDQTATLIREIAHAWSMLFNFNALRVRQMDRKNDTAPLNRKCDHCLRSSHRLEICGSPISGLFVRLWYKLSLRGGCRFDRYGGFW